MTYCCGILVRDGLVMIADTRTNAGLDNISTFRKLHVFKQPGRAHHGDRHRRATCRSASRSSACCARAARIPRPARRETLMNAPTMFQAAQRVGRAIRTICTTIEGKALEASDVKFDVSFLFGGQIKGERLRLFMIYSAGNFIECTHRHALSADRRAQIRQAGARPRHHLRHRSLRRAQDRPDLDRLDHALEPQRRPADRHPGRAARRLRRRAQLPDRAGRALFPRPARALVGGAARRPHRQYPAPALQERR